MTATPTGDLVVGRSHPGRGAWLCRDRPDCLELAVRRRGLERALRRPVAPGGIDGLRRAMGADPDGSPTGGSPECARMEGRSCVPARATQEEGQ